jgi:hypothetical protein
VGKLGAQMRAVVGCAVDRQLAVERVDPIG